MCRFTLYQGPALSLASLLTEPVNSLIHQSFHSHEREEPLNGDGFGLAWYSGGHHVEPGQFRAITPAWNNANLQNLARVVSSGCVLAHVRAATQVRSVSESNCHPFCVGVYSFMHNGDVGGFRALRRALLRRLDDERFDAIQGGTDSEHAFALFLQHLGDVHAHASADAMLDALRVTIQELVALSAEFAPDEPSYLNFAVSNGRNSLVSRFCTEPDYEGESLYLHRGLRYVCEAGQCRMIAPDAEGGAVLICSEPLSEDPGWERIPRNHVVVVDEQRNVRLAPL